MNARDEVAPIPGMLNRACRYSILLGSLFATLGASRAQETPSAPAAPAPSAGDSAAKPAEADEEDFVTLSVFEVKEEPDSYLASRSVSGSRLNTKLEDLAAPITVVTKRQLVDMAAVDINDIFLTEANTEGIYQYTDFEVDRGNIVDTVSHTPERANRIRGMGQANVARGSFSASSSIPIDTYNVDAVEISRGPNSNIFGIGEVAGSINLITAKANVGKSITAFDVRGDSYGGFRSSFDLNRPIIQDKWAVRVLGVYDDRGFERKPSKDETKRHQISTRYEPFRNTTVNFTYERYENTYSRPNSSTPRESISYWRSLGSHTWDPVTRIVHDASGNPVLGTNGQPRVFTDNSANNTALATYGIGHLGSAMARQNWIISEGQVAAFVQGRGGPAGNSQRLVSSGFYGLPNGGLLFYQPGTRDKSFYNWEKLNIAAANYAEKEADIYQAEVEQYLVRNPRHVLAFQAGYYREEVGSHRKSFIGYNDGAPTVVYMDVNERLTDGSPNPGFMRPYLAGNEPQIFRNPEKNDTIRVTGAYFLNLAREEGWMRWLGDHRFNGYKERRVDRLAPRGHRYRDNIVSPITWTGATDNRLYTRYYLGDDVGGNIDNPTIRPNPGRGQFAFRRYDSTTTSWVDEPVEIGERYFALGSELREIHSTGFVWQGFFLDGRIVPLYGRREDKHRTRGGGPVAADPDTGFLDPTNLFRFPDSVPWNVTNEETGARGVTGTTTSKGIVVKPVEWLSLYYNESDSFRPAGFAMDAMGRVLPNPTGTGEDYGLRVTFGNKFVIGINKYENHETDARYGAADTISQRLRRMDFEGAPDSETDGDSWNLENNARDWITATHPEYTAEQVEAAVYGYLGVTPERHAELYRTAMNGTSNKLSKGMELEVYYNPSPAWTMKLTAAKQEAIDSALAPAMKEYMDERMPVWTSVRIPTDPVRNPDGSIATDPETGETLFLAGAGQLWWESLPQGDSNPANIPRTWFEGLILAPYKLASATEGKARPQTRKYRVAYTTTYRFSGMSEDSWLNPLTIGTTIRWEDKAAIGFYGAEPDADGIIRSLDGNRPIWDKARTYVDLMVAYNFKFFDDKIRARAQLNVRNVTENGRLQAVSANPDGTPWNFRIIDPRQVIFSMSFDL